MSKNQKRKKQAPGRNEPCWCGSNKKFKRCHGSQSKIVPHTKGEDLNSSPREQIDEQIRILLSRKEAAELQRQQQQGKGRRIISTEFKGYRVVAVGNKIYWSKNWLTVHDFLLSYIKSILGLDWGSNEQKKPKDIQHPILRWYQLVTEKQAETIKERGKIYSADMTGAVAAYLHLAYGLYLIAHNEKLQVRLVERLKNTDQFFGALYEIRIAAAFVRSGFKIEFENEDDGGTTHCEFTATCIESGKKYSVEAKGRHPSESSGIEKFRWGRRLQKALSKKANHQRIVFLDVNAPDDATDEEVPKFLQKALDHIRKFEGRKLLGHPLEPAYVFVTNFPYHHHLRGTTFRVSVLAEGFQISDFKGGSSFPSIHEAVTARDKHIDMVNLLASFTEYGRIPVTFDGEIPEFSYQENPDRLLIGNSYLITGPDGTERVGKLQSATVAEDDRIVYGIYLLENNEHVICTSLLSDSEFSAYKQHPDTFFGALIPVGRQIKGPIDMYDWIFSVYNQSSKESLLKLMKSENDEQLNRLTQHELAKLYSERMATAMIQQTKSAEPDRK